MSRNPGDRRDGSDRPCPAPGQGAPDHGPPALRAVRAAQPRLGRCSARPDHRTPPTPGDTAAAHLDKMSSFHRHSSSTGLVDDDCHSSSCASCPICLDTIDLTTKSKAGKSVVLKPCNHLFHRKCAKQWFVSEVLRGKSTPSCPLCRAQVEPGKVNGKVPMASSAAGRTYRLFAKVMARVLPGKKNRRRHEEASVSPTLRLYLTNTPN